METPAQRCLKEDLRKIFVGGINSEVTEEAVRDLFLPYGSIEKVEIVKKEGDGQNKKQRMFGFVTFDDMNSCDECFLARPHKIGDNTLEVKRAVPKGNNIPGFTLKTKKLFIANLPKDTKEDDVKNTLLEDHDTKYGEVESVQLIHDKDDKGEPTDVCKGYGFVMASTEDFADKLALKFHNFEFNGRKIELKKSEPRGPAAGGRGGGGRGGGRGSFPQPAAGGYGGWGSYGGQYYGYGYGGYPQAGYGAGAYGAWPAQAYGRGRQYAPY